MDLKSRARRIKEDVPAVFLALHRPETPWYAKVLAALAVAYLLSPVDLIPDFIPVLGQLDDLLLVPLLCAGAIHLIPPEVMAQCREASRGLWDKGRPRKWYYALPIVVVWLLLIALVVKAIW